MDQDKLAFIGWALKYCNGICMKSRLHMFSNTDLIILDLKNMAVSVIEPEDLEYSVLR
jgi:hypothetical protein